MGRGVTNNGNERSGLQYPTRDLREQAATLLALHKDARVLTLPNAWDTESAVMIQGLGAEAIATSSAAIAHTLGVEDGGGMTADAAIAALAQVTGAVSVPVTADLESGYGDVFTTVRRAVGVGVVGANIEDELRPLDRSIALMEAALAGAAAEGVDLVLNARTDVYLLDGIEPARRFDEAVARGRAYLASGATCLFVPGLTDADTVGALVRELGWHSISLLGEAGGPHPQAWAAVGVARVSYGASVLRTHPDDRSKLVARLLADA